MPITTLEEFQNAFKEDLSDEERKQLFETERDNILELAKQLANGNHITGLSELLPRLHPDHYTPVIAIFEAKRTEQAGGKTPYHLSIEIFLGTISALKTAAQAKAFFDYYNKTPENHPNITIIINKLSTLNAEVRCIIIECFSEHINTPEAIEKTLDCLPTTTLNAIESKLPQLNNIINQNSDLQTILTKKQQINQPPYILTKKLTLFLKIYNALRDMASFTFARPNRWETASAAAGTQGFTAEQGETLETIHLYAINNRSSRTATALKITETYLSEYIQEKIDKTNIVTAVIEAGFEEAPCYASITVNGESFFNHKELKASLARADNPALTGDTVDEVRAALGFTSR